MNKWVPFCFYIFVRLEEEVHVLAQQHFNVSVSNSVSNQDKQL